ncbi:hypothetical protein DH2020_023840 [Rehmannia glutinosa]|uniref:DUF4283 domain-containing protein n=1 Tax=Rehmannia glutinosa TaxID=99300 RepID=A0ABR0W779_REHGL
MRENVEEDKLKLNRPTGCRRRENGTWRTRIERVLSYEPWTYNRDLLVLKEFEGMNFQDVGDICHTRFWVQVFNLPDIGMTEKIGRVIGDGIGIALEVDADSEGRCLGSFLRVRVLTDISKPLRRGAPIRMGSKANKIWLDFKYERHPDALSSLESRQHPYGRWLKGEPLGHHHSPAAYNPQTPLSNQDLHAATRRGLEHDRGKGSLFSSNSSQNDSFSSSPSQLGSSTGKEVAISIPKDQNPNSPRRLAKSTPGEQLSPAQKIKNTKYSPVGLNLISMSPSKLLFTAGSSISREKRSNRNWKSAARNKNRSNKGQSSQDNLTPVKRKVNFSDEASVLSPKRRGMGDPKTPEAPTAEVAMQPRRAI